MMRVSHLVWVQTEERNVQWPVYVELIFPLPQDETDIAQNLWWDALHLIISSCFWPWVTLCGLTVTRWRRLRDGDCPNHSKYTRFIKVDKLDINFWSRFINWIFDKLDINWISQSSLIFWIKISGGLTRSSHAVWSWSHVIHRDDPVWPPCETRILFDSPLSPLFVASDPFNFKLANSHDFACIYIYISYVYIYIYMFMDLFIYKLSIFEWWYPNVLSTYRMIDCQPKTRRVFRSQQRFPSGWGYSQARWIVYVMGNPNTTWMRTSFFLEKPLKSKFWQ